MQFKKFTHSLIVALLAFTGISLCAQTFSVSGTVLDGNGDPVENVKIEVAGGSGTTVEVLTASDGTYSVPNLADDTYSIQPSSPYHSFYPTYLEATISGADVPDQDFTAEPPIAPAIIGRILDGQGNPMQGVDVSFQESDGTEIDSVTTDHTGGYAFEPLGDGTYKIVPGALNGYLIDPLEQTVVVQNDVVYADFTALEENPTISGTILDAASKGVDGVSVDFVDDKGVVAGTATTDATGLYTSPALVNNATYIIIPSLAGNAFDPVTLSKKVYGNVTGADFTASLATTSAISGKIADGAGTPQPGINVDVLSGANVVAQGISDAQGKYAVAGLIDGTYVVKPSKAGFVFTPEDASVTIAGADESNIDFVVAIPAVNDPTEIAGCKLWLDGADPAADGTPVAGPLTTWKDKSGNSNDLVQMGPQDNKKPVPSVILDGIATKSIVEFKGGSQVLEFTAGVNVRTVFWVVREKNHAAAHFFLGAKGADPFHRGLKNDGSYMPSGTYWWRSSEDLDDAADEVLDGQTYLDGNKVDGEKDVFPVGKYHVVSLVTTGPVLANTLSTATNGIDRSWNGEIAEMIIYDVELNDSDRTSVDNYLKNKWFKPAAVDDNYVAGKDMQLNVSASAGVLLNDSDIEGKALTAVVDAPPSDGTLTLNPDGSFSYDPAAGFEGDVTFTYKANNGSMVSMPATVTIHIKDAGTNKAPVAVKDSYSTLKNNIISVNAKDGVLVNDSDPDNDPLYAVLVTDVQHGTLTLNADGSFTYEPASDWTGDDTFTYKATDNIAESNEAIVTITVKSELTEPLDLIGCVMWLDGADPNNDGKPVAGKLETWKNKADSILNPYNPDPTVQPTVVLDTLNDLPVVEFSQGKNKLDILDPKDLNKHKKIYGTTYFWVLKEDDIDQSHCFLGNSDNTAFARGLTNDGAYDPDGKYWDDVFAADEVKNGKTFLDGISVDGQKDVFPVGDYHIVSLVATDQVGFDQITQDRAYIADRSWSGGIAEIIAYDRALSNEERVAVESYLETKWIPPAVKARDDEYVTQKNQALDVDVATGVLTNDLGTGITAVLVADVTSGTLTLNADGSFIFTPGTDFSGKTSFTYKVTDGTIESNVAKVTLKVIDPGTNNPPVAVDDVYSAGKDSILSVDAKIGVLANDSDPDGDTITAVLKDDVSKGTLTFNADGSFEYTPLPGWTGEATFTYYATDGVANSNIATVLISVIGDISIPTNIPGCVLWLDGADPKNDGQPVAGKIMAWENKADADRTPYQPDPTNQPSVVLNGLNGLSIMDFAGGNQTYDIIDPQVQKQDLNGTTFFWVLKENNINQPHFFMGYLDTNDNSITPFHRGITNDGAYAPDGKYWDDTYADPEVRDGKTFLDGVAVDGQEDVFPVGDYHIVSLVATGPVTFNQITQDRVYMGDRSWDGGIAEIIVYSGTLDDSARKGVEAYLKAKWFAGTPTFSVSGTILDDSSNPVAGIDVKIDSTHWTTTAADGTYNIRGLADGTYTVTPSAGNYSFTPATAPATISGADVAGVDFTATQTGPATYVVSGTVLDDQGNPLAGVDIEVDATHTATTDASGVYSIPGISAGSYTVTATLANYTFTASKTMPVSVNANTVVDFTGTPAASTFSITGTVTDDQSAGLAGVIVSTDTGESATTDASGVYTISALVDGSYTVTPALGGYTFTPADQSVTIAGADQSGIDFSAAVVAGQYSISGTVKDDTGSPLGNVEIAADAAHTAITAADGTYTISGLAVGDYTVIATLSGYTFTSTATMPVSIVDKDLVDIDFTGVVAPDTYIVSGTVLDENSNPVENVEIAVDATHTAMTATDGTYSIADLVAGDYTVTATLSGYTFTSILTMPVTIVDKDLTGVDFTAKKDAVTYTISGTVLDDQSNPMSGVEVAIDSTHTATTDAAGAYALTGLANGDYDVNATLAGYAFTASETMPVTIADADLTVNFTGAVISGQFAISGTITDADGNGIANVDVTLDANHVVQTDVDGVYSIGNLPDGSYTVTPALAGYSFQPPVKNAVVNGADVVDINFTGEENYAPVAVDDPFFTTNEDTPLSVPATGVLANDTDADNEDFTAVLRTNPSSGTVKLNPNGSFVYTPNAAFTGTDTFTYLVQDVRGAMSNEATVTITVNPAGTNNPPVSLDDKYATHIDTELAVDAALGVLSNDFDIDTDTLTVSVVANPTNGTVVLNSDGSFTYTPNATFDGEDSFTYVANDGTEDGNVAKVTVNVSGSAGDSPVAVDDSYKVTTGNVLTVSPTKGVLANDTDTDGDTLSVVLPVESEPTHGTLSMEANGSFTYTPNDGYAGADSFTYKATDGTFESNVATVNLSVTYQPVTIGTPVSVTPAQAGLAAGATFDKAPKIYGELGGKRLTLKKDKSSSPDLAKGFWAKKFSLNGKIKTGFAGAINGKEQAQQVPLKVKGKSGGSKFENSAQSVLLVPPQVTKVTVSGTTIAITGLYFSSKAPKVMLEPVSGGKIAKCKVDKKAYQFNPATGESSLSATFKTKKAPAGEYWLIIDNKIGIGVEADAQGKPVLPKVTIQ